jgi:DnaA family protein
MARQLPLFRPRSDATFANFWVAPANATSVDALRRWLAAPDSAVLLLFGVAGAGRSHLLQAAAVANDGAVYLPLAELANADPAAVLDELDGAPLLCLDDIDAVTADPAWCEQLFHLFNRRLGGARESRLLVSAGQPATALLCALPDLRSRLGWGGSFQLHALDDENVVDALQLRARERGIDLTRDVATYILARHRRDFPALLALLQALDRDSLAEQKRITIPFVRRYFAATNATE